MASFEVQLRDGLSLKRKMNDQSIRDNNAAWVAGPSRICFLRGQAISSKLNGRSLSSTPFPQQERRCHLPLSSVDAHNHYGSCVRP